MTGAQLELVTDIPELNGDAVLAIGPDAVNDLNLVYQEYCPDGLNSPDCASSLQAAMSVDQEGLQKRIVPLFVGLGIFCAFSAIEYAMYQRDAAQAPKLSRVRMPSANLAKLSSVQGAKTVVFATQTTGGNMITAVPSPMANG